MTTATQITQDQFVTRTGITGYCHPYDARGVTRLKNGKIRLRIVKCDDLEGGYCSAGLFGPQEQYGTYVVYTTGRFDGTDPAAVFAIWFYHDPTKNEADVIECTRWSDPNQPNVYWQTFYKNEVKLGHGKFSGRGYDRHKFVCTLTPMTFTVTTYGIMPDGTEMELGYLTGSREGLPLGNLRIALWLPKTGFTYSRVPARGTLEVTIDKVEFTPLITGSENETGTGTTTGIETAATGGAR